VAFRNRLALPIRVRVTTQGGPGEEITYTQNVSLGGVYFRTLKRNREGWRLQVTYPYWTDHGSINREYPARIGRLDRLSSKAWGVGVEFLQNLHDKTTLRAT
jgi:PilZ domain